MAEVVPSLGPPRIVAGIALTALAGLLVEQLVDYLSWRYRMSAAGIAAVFVPLLTSLPELAVFAAALVRGEVDIAWGSIIADPFTFSTIIYPLIVLTSLAAWSLGRRRHAVPRVRRRVAVPLLAFSLPLLPILALHPEGRGLYGRLYGLALIALYFAYVGFMLRREEAEREAERLWLRHPAPQTLAAAAAMAFGAEWMVDGVKALGEAAGLDKVALSVVLVPVATVAPEVAAGLAFVARGRDD